MNNTPTPRTDEWEAHCDECYCHFWRLRRKTGRGWYDGFHIHTGEEAKGLCDLLNKLETELAAVTEQRDEYKAALQSADNHNHEIATKLEIVTEQRDEARELALNFRDALVSIEEYWNRDQNETAMADACWHAVNMAHDALAKAKEVLP